LIVEDYVAKRARKTALPKEKRRNTIGNGRAQEKRPRPHKTSTSEHVVAAKEGSYGIRIDHREYHAIQYDFFIPVLIWNHYAVQEFIEELSAVELGATIFRRVTGIWKGELEGTNIYRIIVYGGRFRHGPMRLKLQKAIGDLMAKLEATPKLAQQAVLFTETAIELTMSGNVRRR
jgi:hypothetical protein